MVTLKLTASGQNITVHTSNGDKQGYTPDNDNEIIVTLAEGDSWYYDPNSVDRIVATVIQSVDV